MNRLTAPLALAAAFVLAGCSTPSLNGFAEADRVALDGLEGVWIAEDTVARVTAADDTLYLISTSGSRHVVEMAIAEIDGHHVADATLGEESIDHADPVLLSFVIPVHKFARLDLDGDTLRYAELKDGWVGDHADGAGLTKVDDNNVLTGTSAQIRALLAEALKHDDAWEDGQTFTRLQEVGD